MWKSTWILFGFLILVDGGPVDKDAVKYQRKRSVRTRPYVGHQLLSSVVENAAQVELLRMLQANGDMQLDFFTEPQLGTVFIRVPPTSSKELSRILRRAGIKVTTKVKDMQALVDKALESSTAQKPMSLMSRASASGCTDDIPDHTQVYLTLEQIWCFVNSLKDRHSGLEVFESDTYKTYEGRSMWYVKIATVASVSKPAIMVESLTHAREWVTGSVSLDMMDKMTRDYGIDSDVTFMLDTFDWYFVPVHNPDGYDYTHNGDRLWRKNRERFDWRCSGVDLNRNWNANWGGVGSSSACTADTYRGPEVMSTPEARFLDDVMVSIPNKIAFISLHSFSQMLLIPYGYDMNKEYTDKDLHRSMAMKAAAAIRNVHGKVFTVGTPGDLLYQASGGAFDYFKDIGIPFSFTYELRPSGSEGHIGFLLPPSDITAAQEETWASMVSFADEFAGHMHTRDDDL